MPGIASVLQNHSQILLDESTDVAYMIYMSQIIFTLSDLFHELFVLNTKTYLLLCVSLSLHVRVRFILHGGTVQWLSFSGGAAL